MRSIFWFLTLAAAAIVLALLVGDNDAGVTVFWFPYRIDLSFNLVLFGALALFVLLHLGLRGVAALRDLPHQARRWRLQQLERGATNAVLDALAYQLAGRFVRAQSSAQHALSQLQGGDSHLFAQRDQLMVLAHLLAAESAQSLRDPNRRDRWLAGALDSEAASHASVAREGALLRAADWALEERNTELAASRLAALPQGAARRIGALRLKLRLARLNEDTQGALELVRLLTKHRAFTAQASASLVRGLVLDALRSTHDPAQLAAVWGELDAAERATPELALAALDRRQHLLGQGVAAASPAPASASASASASADTLPLLKEALGVLWERLPTLGSDMRWRVALHVEQALPELPGDWLGRIEDSQARYPSDLVLQYLAGQAFMQRRLWGKAAALLNRCVPLLENRELARRGWCSLAQLAEERGDAEAAQAAWKRAAQS
jgi:HemY protein